MRQQNKYKDKYRESVEIVRFIFLSPDTAHGKWGFQTMAMMAGLWYGTYVVKKNE